MNENDSKKKRDREKNFRNQILELSFKHAMRSAQAPVEADGYFHDLLKKLDEAEKKQR